MAPTNSTTVPSTVSKKDSDSNFPAKLHYLLDELSKDGMEHIIGWRPHGRAFMVKDQAAFAESVLPLWFRQTKFSSFQRQLNLYGFHRISSGIDKGCHYHECFLRGMPSLTAKIRRTKIKGTGARKARSPEDDPDFYSMPAIPVSSESNTDKFSPVAPAARGAASTPVLVTPVLAPEIETKLLNTISSPAISAASSVPSSALALLALQQQISAVQQEETRRRVASEKLQQLQQQQQQKQREQDALLLQQRYRLLLGGVRPSSALLQPSPVSSHSSLREVTPMQVPSLTTSLMTPMPTAASPSFNLSSNPSTNKLTALALLTANMGY